MRVLLDTHVLIAVARRNLVVRHPDVAAVLSRGDVRAFASIVSVWEIAIKVRLGKLDVAMALDELAPYFATLGMGLLRIDAPHVVADVQPRPATRDPFDNLLLAQCHVERLRLVTLDHALRDHPLAARLA